MSTPFIVSVPDQRYPREIARLGLPSASADVEMIDWDLRGDPPVAEIDLVVLPETIGEELSQLSQVRARLVQWQSIGYDVLIGRVPPGHVVANAATVHETSTAEFAVALALAAQRGIPELARSTSWGDWSGSVFPSLADRRVLLLGYGGVNQAVERRLAGFELGGLVRVGSRPREEQGVRVHGVAELPTLLPHADVVIVAVPLDGRTRGLVGHGELGLLPDGALVVNVARGPVVDTDAVLAQAGRLRFALDVTDPEPLPDGHPLRAAPGVLIAPHIGGSSSALLPRMARLIDRQISHLRAGEQPENIVIRS